MKILIKSLFGFLALCLFLASCKKEENSLPLEKNKSNLNGIIINAYIDSLGSNEKDVERLPGTFPNGTFSPSIQLTGMNVEYYTYRVRLNYEAPNPGITEWQFSIGPYGDFFYVYKTTHGENVVDIKIPYPISGPLNVEVRCTYTIYDPNTNSDPKPHTIKGGVCEIAVKNPSTEIAPIYFYRKSNPHDYYLSISDAVKEGGWVLEDGAAFKAHTTKASSSTSSPVYEYISQDNRVLFFSTSDNPGSNWKRQHIAFYAYKYQHTGTIPVYLFRNKDTGAYYLCTYRPLDVDSPWWVYNGVAFYAFPK